MGDASDTIEVDRKNSISPVHSLAADGFARQDKPNLALSEPPIVPLVAQRGLIACGGCFVVG